MNTNPSPTRILAEPSTARTNLAFVPRAPSIASRAITPLLQRQCSCGGSGGPTGECAECRKKKLLQRLAKGPAHDEAPRIVHEVLASSGRPLTPETRAFFEPRLGHDFASVRIHDDSRAAQSANAVSALAYTVGRHVVSGVGNLDSPSPANRQLLAHELTHVVQQSGVPDGPSPSLRVGAPDTSLEAEAHQASAIARGPASPTARRTSGPTLQRLGAADKGQPPCALDAYRAEWRSVDVQPVFFKSSAADASPTGTTWANRLSKSNEIWKKLGVSFSAKSPVTLVDATSKTAGTTDAEFHAVRATRTEGGVEVFMVDNDMAKFGGGGTVLGGSEDAQIVLSDRGTSDTLLAHELGHVLGLKHPPASDANTIMEGSNSHSAPNPTRNTVGNYNKITWPAPGGPTCIKPDA